MAARVLFGLAAVTFAGLIWTSVDREAKPAPTSEFEIEQPLTEAESRPARAATRARGSRGGGGLPARDRGARGRQPSGLASAAQPASIGTRAMAQPAPSASADQISTRHVPRVTPASFAGASQPGGVDTAPPPDEERPRSSGIAGTVLEKSGGPVAGLSVALRARRVFNGAAASAARTATTDGGGSFAFGAVADGEYEIRTEKNDRYESASTLVRAGTDAAVLVVEPSSTNALSIHGVVESSKGGPLADVRVEVIGQAIAVSTDAAGAYALRIPAGARVEQTALRFRRTGYRDRRWAMSEGLRANDHEVIGNVHLDPLAAGVSVSGVVTATTGTPVARARVQLDSAARGRGYRATTDAGGRFTLENVDAGSDYRLWVRPQSGFKDGVIENVLVDAPIQSLDVKLTPIGVATLRGRLVTPEGAAVPGFTMWLTSAYGSGPRSLSLTSDSQGRFIAEDLPEGPVTLQTRSAPALSASGIEVRAAAPGGTDVTVVVDVGAYRLEGRLVTSEGAPASGARVSLEWSASSGGVTSRSTRDTVAGADGTFVFTQVGGGVHLVSAALEGAGSVRVQQQVGAGAAPLQLMLPGKRGHQ